MPAPEPLSQVLRRLHEEATREATSTDEVMARKSAGRISVNLLPALADLVAAVERGAEQHGWDEHHADALLRSLAVLRERLGAKS